MIIQKLKGTKPIQPSVEEEEARAAPGDVNIIKCIKRVRSNVENTLLQLTAFFTGTIERGHVYFFYRPRVQHEEAHSLDDVRNLHMLLVPRPPEWLASLPTEQVREGEEKPEKVEPEMKVLSPGADVVPSAEPLDTPKKHFRVITIGRKHLPTEEIKPGAVGRGRKVYWATVTSVGDDLDSLEKGFGEKTYETKTRGERHEAPVRLAARGAYAIVNTSARVPSGRTTHFGYRISHPPPESFGDVQEELGIREAAAFVLQVKNPLAPATAPQQARTSRKVDYPDELMSAVFGTGVGGKGREGYGLRFASCETPELLDYEGAQLLLLAARDKQEGLQKSIGEEQGEAMKEAAEKESVQPIEDVFRELSFDKNVFPAEPLRGEWI
ncbi:hypothetical protein AX17_006702 [Amanita inopinata Kibby_2008]|nr:hypothetical protein AX17_006702 [Amanita inopinata Kibby_2008]